MRAAGILPEDAPDPRTNWVERLKLMPIPVLWLMAQPSLEDTDAVGLSCSGGDGGYSELTASITYTLWRNPDDRSDPVNLAVLDEARRRSIEDVPPWPRPPWLIEQVERLRYPELWELWPGSNPWDQHPPEVTGQMVNSHARTAVEGVDVPGAEVDTAPFVHGIGARLAGGGVVTAVLPLAELKYIQVQFTTRG